MFIPINLMFYHLKGRRDVRFRLKSIIKSFVRKLIETLHICMNMPLILLDMLTPKRNDYWIFPTYFIGEGAFCDNNLAVFEKVKYDRHIKKIILTKSKKVNVYGENIIVIPINSIRAIWYIFRSNVIFIQHSIWLDLSQSKYQLIYPFSRHIINLWHGVAIKDISHPNTGIVNNRSELEIPNYSVIASSSRDAENMKKAFHLAKKENFWVTGLPRNDFLKMDENNLPHSYQKELNSLRVIKRDKRLILYAPTYREVQSGGRQYEFTELELVQLNEYLIKANAILGLRYHIYRKPNSYEKLLSFENIIEISEEMVSDVRLIIRESDLIITDYSSLYVDALYIDKPCLSFSYDYDHYMKNQRGFFYDFDSIFPGKICKSFDILMCELYKNVNFNRQSSNEIVKINKIKKTLFKYNDSNNSQRVIDNVMEFLK